VSTRSCSAEGIEMGCAFSARRAIARPAPGSEISSTGRDVAARECGDLRHVLTWPSVLSPDPVKGAG
jgi:hypothetical protein